MSGNFLYISGLGSFLIISLRIENLTPPTWNWNSHSFFFSNLMASLIPPRLLRYKYNTDPHRATPAWGTPTTRSPTPPSPTRTPLGRRCSGPPTAWRTLAWRDRDVASPHNQQSVVINVCILGINKTHDRAVTMFKHSAFEIPDISRAGHVFMR